MCLGSKLMFSSFPPCLQFLSMFFRRIIHPVQIISYICSIISSYLVSHVNRGELPTQYKVKCSSSVVVVKAPYG